MRAALSSGGGHKGWAVEGGIVKWWWASELAIVTCGSGGDSI